MYYNQESVAVECKVGQGTLVQTGAVFYGVFNSDWYSEQDDVANKSSFISQYVLTKIQPHLKLKGPADRIAIFGRTDGIKTWVTLKSSRKGPAQVMLTLPKLNPNRTYLVQDLLSLEVTKLTGQELIETGVAVRLEKLGSTVVTIEEK
jgi:hypothetical protein